MDSEVLGFLSNYFNSSLPPSREEATPIRSLGDGENVRMFTSLRRKSSSPLDSGIGKLAGRVLRFKRSGTKASLQTDFLTRMRILQKMM